MIIDMAKDDRYTTAMDNLLFYIGNRDEKQRDSEEKIQNEYSELISKINTEITPRAKELYKLIVIMSNCKVENCDFMISSSDKNGYGFFRDNLNKGETSGVWYANDEFGITTPSNFNNGRMEASINMETGRLYYNGDIPSKKCNYMLYCIISRFDEYEKKFLDYINNTLYERGKKLKEELSK